MSPRRSARLVAAAVLLALAGAAPARAFYGNGATIMSANLATDEEGDSPSTFGAISQDGRFVAMDTQATNFYPASDPDPAGQFRIGGVFRRGVDDSSLAKVADGNTFDLKTGALLFQGARSPSISADGRYVAFVTDQKLVLADTNDAADVYVRDMSVPACSPLPTCAPNPYTLVSVNNDGTPATYQQASGATPGQEPGTDIWPGTSISADGSRVVFRQGEVPSNLPGGGSTNGTPPFELYVRDLGGHTTTLVTQTTGGSPSPAGGAFGPASISGDGSTVAWTGANAASQTPFLSGEFPNPNSSFYLWRRVAPGAPTRRVTGIADLDDPGCDPQTGSVSSSQTATGACYGPLTVPDGYNADISQLAPALSQDGYTVGFLTGAGPRPTQSTGSGLDAYMTSMAPGVTRKAGTRELSREGVSSDALASAPLQQIAMSADGSHIAVVSARGHWVLPFPAAIGTFRASASSADVDLINLAAGTIERVTRAYDGSHTVGDASRMPTLSADGSRVAFGDEASNLFFGDANAASDVFVARLTAPSSPSSPAPNPPLQTSGVEIPAPSGSPEIRVVSVVRLRDGRVRVIVRVPEAGALSVVARGLAAATHTHGKRRARAHHARTKRRRRGSTGPGGATVTAAQAVARGSAFITLILTPRGRYATLVRGGTVVRARALLTFLPSRRAPALRASTTLTFQRTVSHRRRGRKK